MLEEINVKDLSAKELCFGLVASKFNQSYVDSMLNAAIEVLRKSEAKSIDIIRVPGAYEIPVIAGHLVYKKSHLYDAVICLGVVFRGETTHAKHISEAVCNSLADLQTNCQIPIVNGVYLFENKEQGDKRCMDPKYNRGVELANTAIEMAALMKKLKIDI